MNKHDTDNSGFAVAVIVILAFLVAGGIIIKKDYRHYDSAPIETVK